jgi:hypothetical protein
MYIKNRLNPGDWAMPVPVGIKVALQYNERGQLQTVYTGWGIGRREAPVEMFDAIRNLEGSPVKIHIEHATSMVSAVLYTASLVATTGEVPEVVLEALIQHFLEDPADFSLWGAIFETTAAPVTTAIENQRALIAAKFKPLPQYLLPHNLSDEVIDQLVGNDRFPFTYPLITDWVIYRDGSHRVMQSPLSEFLVNDLEVYNDENGYVHVKLTDSYGKTMTLDYSVILDGSIHSGSLIFLNEVGELVHVEYLEGADTTRSLAVRCAHCGSELTRVQGNMMRCSNIHCPSLMRPQIIRMATILNLPAMTDDVLDEILANAKHGDRPSRLSDIFDYEPFTEGKFKSTIMGVLSAMIPSELIPNINVYKEFNLACGGNMTRIMHYIDYPQNIISELHLNDQYAKAFVRWLEDDDNRASLKVTLDHFDLVGHTDKLVGVPIFRGKHICITGQFIRGSQCEISDILESYSAVVTTTLESNTDAVIVGGQFDGIDGQIIAKARQTHRQVFSEDEFFRQYEIDEDLKQIR